MSEAKEQNDTRPNNGGVGRTRSSDGSVVGPGGQIGKFRIEQELGRGGEGVVYLARDTKLNRSVAIKRLPDEVVSSPKVRTRFAREARVLASLNHPNIATIYELLQEAGGISYLVLEYIPGQTLVDRIASARLKPQEALSIAEQIAEAVAAAHDLGIIHRDLKPGNIKITPEGRIKVLDFGLAKVLSSEVADQQDTVTIPGRIMGTPAYMCPEQARGQEADERCDIWSFGCVLYEMLAGKVPFEGETASDILAGILNHEPDWQALPRSTPANIQVLLRRCLEKDSRRRLHDIVDAAIEINETLNLPATVPPVTTHPISLEPQIVVNARSRKIAMVLAATIIIVLVAIAGRFIPTLLPRPPSEKIRLVVLPFQNPGSSNDDYFVTGITEAITSRLAGIRGLSVISPRTAEQYKDSKMSTQAIGKELGVAYVLEGIVQRERPTDPNSRVRIIPRLIRASDDKLLSSPVYNENMSEIFGLQANVAERVAKELDLTLLEPERRAMAYRPTENMNAYDYYLKGYQYHNRGLRKSDLNIAIQMYEKAVELDPKYALAFTQLSRCHATIYWQYYDHTPDRLQMAEKNVQEALRLEPDLPEAHLALGHYYYCKSDWDQALREFAIARMSLPNDSDLLSFTGFVQRRQGKFPEALANISSASELNPRSNNMTISLGETLIYMRKYPEAMSCFKRAISLAPDEARPYGYKAALYLLSEGSIRKAREVVDKALEAVALTERSAFFNVLINLDVYDRNYQNALRRVSLRKEDIDTQDFFIPVAMQNAQIHSYMEDDLARKYYDEGRKIVEAKILDEPNDARLHSTLGIAYAGLGRRQDAIREGELAVKLLPVSKDAMRGICRVRDLARIYVMVNKFDLAVKQIEFLLSIPSDLSKDLLRLDPAWDPLRGHLGFQTLIKGK